MRSILSVLVVFLFAAGCDNPASYKGSLRYDAAAERCAEAGLCAVDCAIILDDGMIQAMPEWVTPDCKLVDENGRLHELKGYEPKDHRCEAGSGSGAACERYK